MKQELVDFKYLRQFFYLPGESITFVAGQRIVSLNKPRTSHLLLEETI